MFFQIVYLKNILVTLLWRNTNTLEFLKIAYTDNTSLFENKKDNVKSLSVTINLKDMYKLEFLFICIYRNL